MVTTIDGKILTGGRDQDVLDLGSKNDRQVMQRLLAASDAVMIGAQTLRASPLSWTPKVPIKIVVTASGRIPFEAGFFKGGQSFVATTDQASFETPDEIQVLRAGNQQAGNQKVDFLSLFELLRNRLGVKLLSVLGGSELNAQLIQAGLIDELFVTIAPKVKLGRDVPTYADGDALGRDEIQNYRLVEHHAIDNEIFIRYRRESGAAQ